MKKYIISLDIITSLTVSAYQLENFLGIKESAFSRRQIKEGYLWKYEVEDKSLALLDGINFITSQLQVKHPIQFDEDIKKIYLNIGVRYDTMTCTINFPGQVLDTVCKKIPQLVVEIACYPVDNEVEE